MDFLGPVDQRFRVEENGGSLSQDAGVGKCAGEALSYHAYAWLISAGVGGRIRVEIGFSW